MTTVPRARVLVSRDDLKPKGHERCCRGFPIAPPAPPPPAAHQADGTGPRISSREKTCSGREYDLMSSTLAFLFLTTCIHPKSTVRRGNEFREPSSVRASVKLNFSTQKNHSRLTHFLLSKIEIELGSSIGLTDLLPFANRSRKNLLSSWGRTLGTVRSRDDATTRSRGRGC